MGRWKKISPEARMRAELKVKFQEQERMTLQEATEEYYEPKSPYSFIIARTKMSAIFRALKRVFGKDRIPFGCVNEHKEWGIPTSKEEYEFMGIRRYTLVKGIIKGSQMIISSGVRAGLIKGKSKSETIMIPVLEKNDKKSKDK